MESISRNEGQQLIQAVECQELIEQQEQEWDCWQLKQSQILAVARRIRLSDDELAKLDMDKVAERFKGVLKNEASDWHYWLESIIIGVLYGWNNGTGRYPKV